MRRVAIGEDSDVFLFDIGPNVTFPDAAVRVATEFNNSCKLDFSLEIQIQTRMHWLLSCIRVCISVKWIGLQLQVGSNLRLISLNL